ncbi:MAG: diadenylate cyclase [Candidatus Aenigmatarchaeota archaeon]|nr:MAG: diadenylate cyclase [Candidatus Aenigmarchaeota archaeon]
MRLDEFIGKTTARVVSLSDASVLLVTKRQNSSIFDLTLFKEDRNRINRIKYSVNVSKLPAGSIARIRAVVIEAINKGILKSGDNVLCVTDKSLGEQFEGLFLLFKIDEEFLNVSEKKIEKESKQNVFETLLNIAREIGREGREGRKIGTGFIFGDSKNVMKKSTQLILNPFSSAKYNIMQAGLKETIKEFAQLDGFFVVGEDGVIHAAGRYLSIDTSGIDMPGLGARHLSAAAITRETDAVAIVVSESGGIIRVFKGGKMIKEESP